MPRKFSMHLDDGAVERIEQLQRRTKSASVPDVIRLALLVLDEQVNWLRAGGTMFVQAAPGAPLRPYNPILNGDELVVETSAQATASKVVSAAEAKANANEPTVIERKKVLAG